MRLRHLVAVAVLAACSFEHGTSPPGKDAAAGGGGAVGDGPAAGGDCAMADSGLPPNGIACPGTTCGPVCCDGMCTNIVLGVCIGRSFRCDGPEDCPGQEVCCNDKNGSYCTQTCGGSGHFEACHTTADCSFSCNDCGYRDDYGQMVCCE